MAVPLCPFNTLTPLMFAISKKKKKFLMAKTEEEIDNLRTKSLFS